MIPRHYQGNKKSTTPDCSSSAPESNADLCGRIPVALGDCRSLVGIEQSHVGLKYRKADVGRRSVVPEQFQA